MSVATVQNADILEALSQGKHCHMFTRGKGSDSEASKRNITGNYVERKKQSWLSDTTFPPKQTKGHLSAHSWVSVEGRSRGGK